MFGLGYSIKEHYSFSGKELTELLWTSLVLALTLTAYFKKFLIKAVLLEDVITFFIFVLIFAFIAMYCHVALQKVVGIKLGYKVTYSYWLNGLLISVFLSLLTFGMVPVLSTFVLPGAVKLEHIPKLRLGKFRYGTNLKDLARINLAGPLAHVILVMILGIFYLSTGKGEFLYMFIVVNLLIAIYSMLPIPKIDFPTRMDTATDGLGIFFFSRTIYVLCLATIVIYAALVLFATIFSFVLAFVMGLIVATIYLITVEQKN